MPAGRSGVRPVSRRRALRSGCDRPNPGRPANLLREDKPARKAVKQSRWLLLRNRDNLKDGQAVQLQELLAANQPLATVYVLKDALKDVWYAPSVREGWRRWRTRLRHARESDLAPLQRFARNLRKYARGILASAHFHMHTSVLEGVNNRIKVIKRMAYGFRDSEYFFLKIKAAFPESAMNLFGAEISGKGQRAAPLTFVAICRSEIAARASPTINQSSE